MSRRKAIKAVCIPVAFAVGTCLVKDADNPHVEQRQYEEEPRMTYDSPYSTTSGTVARFSFWNDFSLSSIPVTPVKVVPVKPKKK